MEENKTIQQLRAEIAGELFNESLKMTAEYKALVRHTGSLLSQSMAVAYSRAINDVIKFILKQNEGDKNVQESQNTESSSAS